MVLRHVAMSELKGRRGAHPGSIERSITTLHYTTRNDGDYPTTEFLDAVTADSNDDGTRSLARYIGASPKWTHSTRRDTHSRRVSPRYEVVKSTCYDADLLELPLENTLSETWALIRR